MYWCLKTLQTTKFLTNLQIFYCPIVRLYYSLAQHLKFGRLCTFGTSQILDYCVAKQHYIKNVVHRITWTKQANLRHIASDMPINDLREFNLFEMRVCADAKF